MIVGVRCRVKRYSDIAKELTAYCELTQLSLTCKSINFIFILLLLIYSYHHNSTLDTILILTNKNNLYYNYIAIQ